METLAMIGTGRISYELFKLGSRGILVRLAFVVILIVGSFDNKLKTVNQSRDFHILFIVKYPGEMVFKMASHAYPEFLRIAELKDVH